MVRDKDAQLAHEELQEGEPRGGASYGAEDEGRGARDRKVIYWRYDERTLHLSLWRLEE